MPYWHARIEPLGSCRNDRLDMWTFESMPHRFLFRLTPLLLLPSPLASDTVLAPLL